MKGASHALVGTAIGLSIAVYYDMEPAATGLAMLLGSTAALAPDLDTNGRLSNRISLHRKWLWYTLSALGVLIGIYSLVSLNGLIKAGGVIAAVILIIAPRFLIKQRFMVMLTGFAIMGVGWFYTEYWMIYFGLFTTVSSFLPHRGLTHSIPGLIVFTYIAHTLELRLNIEGITAVCFLAYLSHLVLDMKALPFNKKGVKWLLPFYSREF
ncbi:metal-dependent hydrolase [Jeotgalibacillus haloalkalitolerans]|uniref:Metal-dependent hydrolase n=1 Tax=Jeotgalibacillus haloalkalitolerans TaxID=3104292 RepID=A0ABU5KKT6_9BACL|nr:metal-dependent hydrolase [Jeotgalibacillus sp. HH7-29]MDZ5711879.1 metal-dependent hydrolase [Jeotgalibacillus sp. HH7-29]